MRVGSKLVSVYRAAVRLVPGYHAMAHSSALRAGAERVAGGMTPRPPKQAADALNNLRRPQDPLWDSTRPLSLSDFATLSLTELWRKAWPAKVILEDGTGDAAVTTRLTGNYVLKLDRLGPEALTELRRFRDLYAGAEIAGSDERPVLKVNFLSTEGARASSEHDISHLELPPLKQIYQSPANPAHTVRLMFAGDGIYLAFSTGRVIKRTTPTA